MKELKKYWYSPGTEWCKVYNYTLNTIPKMEAQGYLLVNTYTRSLVFYKYIDN